MADYKVVRVQHVPVRAPPDTIRSIKRAGGS